MKLYKLFLLIPVTLILSVKVFGQASVDILFSATDSAYISMNFSVGLDMVATNCVDTILGEYDIPVLPEPGMFEIRFDLSPYGCPGLSSYKDYRAPGNPPVFPFTGMIEHTIWFQTSSIGLPIYITYNLPIATVMTITDPFGGSFLNIGPFTGQGIAIIPGTYFFNKALLKMDYDNIVPIELISFTASILQSEKAVQLNWTTATETNNSRFEINRKKLEARSQEIEWKDIGFVPGFGTTTELKSYSFIDKNVTTGTYKYRLKQIDFDGTFAYSNEIEVAVDFTPKGFVLYQNYPNPFNPTTTIKYAIPSVASDFSPSKLTLKVFDVLGKEVAALVNEEKQPGVYEVEFNAGSLASGTYLYKLQAGSNICTGKMLLLK